MNTEVKSESECLCLERENLAAARQGNDIREGLPCGGWEFGVSPSYGEGRQRKGGSG